MKFLFILVFLVGSLYSSTNFEKIYQIYSAGDFKTSFKDFKILAEQGDEDAAYILAHMYENGEGCKVDKIKADKWYKISSKIFYYNSKDNPNRGVQKEKNKLYRSLQKLYNNSTADTIKRYAQSLYNIRAYKAIYFLPFSYRYKGDYPSTDGYHAKDEETEFQISIRYDFAVNLLSLNEIYTIAYSQLSFWQLYEDSAYFRETNYNPEFLITFPMSELYNTKYLKVMKLALAHQSNGRGGSEERSWNYLSSSFVFQYKTIFTELELWYRLPDKTDYNPNLIDYMGHGHIRFILPYKQHMAQIILKSNFKGKSSMEVNYSYPAFGRDDLFFYLKSFNGYGESLIDYDHNIEKIGVGFSISR